MTSAELEILARLNALGVRYYGREVFERLVDTERNYLEHPETTPKKGDLFFT